MSAPLPLEGLTSRGGAGDGEVPAPARHTRKVIGLDLSLTGTGVAGDGWSETITPGGLRGYVRLRHIRRTVLELVQGVDLVVVESPAWGAQGASAHQLAGAWWLITEAVDARIPMALCNPATLKKYALGVGGGPRSGKDFMVAAATRAFPWLDGDNNACDAAWLMAIGRERIGQPLPITRTAVQRAAAAAVVLPDRMEDQ